MTDPPLTVGQRVRIVADGEMVRLPGGRLGVLIDDRGAPAGQTLFDVSGFEVRTVDEPVEYEWSVVYPGGDESDHYDNEHAAHKEATRSPSPGGVVHRRTVGPWEVAAEPAHEKGGDNG